MARANGENMIAIGREANAFAGSNGSGSIAVGYRANAQGNGVSAIGDQSSADGDGASAFGYDADASAANATALGRSANAAGTSATALGRDSLATNTSSLAIGNTNLQFTLTGAEPAVNTAIFVLGAWGSTFTCGTCTILNPVISVPVPVSAGDASLPVPLGCDMSLFGGTFAVQWWPVGTSATPCAFLPTVSFSNTFNGQVGF